MSNQIQQELQETKANDFESKKKTYQAVLESAKKYRSTLRGVLNSRFAKMEQEAIKHQIPIMSKDAFMRFNIDVICDFKDLHEEYCKSGYKRDLMPVIQLIEKKKGCIAGNFIWTTLGEKVNSGIFVKVTDTYDGSEHHFASIKEAERHFKLPEGVLYRPLKKNGKYKNLRIMLEA